MKKYHLICYLFFLFLSLTTKGQQIIFTPQWIPQSQFAGYYVALAKGFYKEAGVDVVIQHPSASNPAVKRLKEGSCNITTLQLLQAMVEIDKGTPLINILQTSQRNSLMIVSRTDSIRTFKDLKGKKVGVWKAGFGELGYIIDSEQQLDIQWIPFVQGINLFIAGAIDATLGMSYNEYLQIRASGLGNKPTISFAESSYDFPEDGVYVNASFYQRYPKQVKAFAEASKRGWEWVHQHSDEALEIVMQMVQAAKVPTNRILQKWMLEEILKQQCRKGETTPSFELEKDKVDHLSKLLIKYKYIHSPISWEQLKGGQP
jgi:NitT/TauT family transport system substrate-binding protein